MTRSQITPDLTSPLSFRTAVATQSSQTSELSTNDAKSDSDLSETKYRTAKVLPYELRHHCLVYFEEQIYTSALSLLNSLLISTAYSVNKSQPAFIPPPNVIALISTLLIHPSHTTRAPSKELLCISSQSLTLLRNILSIVGPLNANLADAFVFKRAPRRGRKSNRKNDTSSRNSPDYDEEAIQTALADESSIWQRAQDFWNVVGWSFNCSIKYHKRWEYWRIWLEYMLDVLEADWEERSRLDNGTLEDCLLVRYLTDAGTSSSTIKRILKSIFTNGEVDALRAYPEVFENETKDRGESTGTKRKRDIKVDLEEDIYGDFARNIDDELDDNNFNSSQPEQSSQDVPMQGPEAAQNAESNETICMGGPEAVVLRLRMLALLSRTAFILPDVWINIIELYSIIREIINALPLQSFSLFLSSSARPYIPDDALSSLTQLHLLHFLPSGARTPVTDELSQESLEEYFLPATANTSSAEDNAKVSLLAETLFRIFITSCGAENTPELAMAVEKGINAREKKCNDRRKKVGWAKDDPHMSWLNASAERIRLLLQFIQK